MESADSQTGIIGAGVIAEDPRAGDLDRRIAERCERSHQARLVRWFLIAWAGPGNLLLAALTASVLLFDGTSWGMRALFMLATAVSVAASVRLLYVQHLKVRAVTSELREIQRAHRENLMDDFSGDLLGVQKRYRAQLPYVIDDYRTEAARHRWKNHTLQCVIIVGSILTASVTAASVSVVDVRWAAVAISLLVAVSAGLSAYAKYQERGVRLLRTAEALEREYQSVELRVGRYRKFDDEREAYAEFADTVEALRTDRVGDPSR